MHYKFSINKYIYFCINLLICYIISTSLFISRYFDIKTCAHYTNKYGILIIFIILFYSWVQNELVQAEYWHDPLNEKLYIKESIFLSDINNERKINKDYIKNLGKLANIVFIKFNNDTMVLPKESEWFGFYTPGQALNITDLWNSKLYKEVCYYSVLIIAY